MKNTPKHTPGEWEVDRSVGMIFAAPVDEGDQALLVADFSFIPGHTTDEEWANGYLMAAAPKMLEALKGEHNACDWLMARLIELDQDFLPTKSPIWKFIVAGDKAISDAENAKARNTEVEQ